MSDKLTKLQELSGQSRSNRRHKISNDEIVEAAKAIRRGASVRDAASILGIRDTSLYVRLGRWAIDHCQCFGSARFPELREERG